MTRIGIFLCVIAAFLARAKDGHAGPFEVRDTGWEGCSDLFDLARTELGRDRVIAVSELDWKTLRPDDGLLLLHPTRSVSSDRLGAFLRGGGRVAVVDDFGAGSKILERFGIERVRAPQRPLATLRHNADLVVAEPVRESVDGHGERVHPTVENVERLVTNHPTGLHHPKMGRVLKMRGIDEPEVSLALAGELDEAPLGKLFAMGDPSALINQMLRYPGNRAFALGLIHYLAQDLSGQSRGRLFVVTNDFSESGAGTGLSDLPGEIDNRVDSLARELKRLFHGGLTGVVGIVAAAAVALAVGLWTTSVASRTYARKLPSFARSVPLVAQGGAAGRAAVLGAPTTPRALVVLELKSALEEGLAHALGFASPLPSSQLLAELASRSVLDAAQRSTLKSMLLEMANIETLVVAGQAGGIKKADLTRFARLTFELLAEAARSTKERSAA